MVDIWRHGGPQWTRRTNRVASFLANGEKLTFRTRAFRAGLVFTGNTTDLFRPIFTTSEFW